MSQQVCDYVKQRSEERVGTGNWLLDSVTFNHGYSLIGGDAITKAENLLNELLQNRKRKTELDKKLLDTCILCANLLVKKRCKPVAISLNRNNYVKNRYRLASYFTCELVQWMEENGWIECWKGYNKEEKKDSRLTRISPTMKFMDYFGKNTKINLAPVELVILRDEKGNIVDYNETPNTNNIRRILQHANHVNRNALVQLKKVHKSQCLNTDLHAVFNNSSFDQSGRLYCGYGGYQCLSGEERKNILIDGQATVELDFAGMQPRLLYTMVGEQYEGDPYSPVCDGYDDLRGFAKNLLLALLHAKSITKAVASGNYERFNNNKLHHLLKKRNITTKDLIARFKENHPKIERLFCENTGFQLMNLDAKIALEIVDQFTKKDIPILAIHDSFIVTKDRQNDLRNVMHEAYKKHTKGFCCPIK